MLPMPVIAAVHGVAFGGGFQIMSGADLRIAAPATRFSIREVHWGLVPDMAGFALWRNLVRDDLLRELIYTAREFDAAEALATGFVTRLAEEPQAEAMALARTIAAHSPHAIRGAKRLLGMAHDADPRTMLAAETAFDAVRAGDVSTARLRNYEQAIEASDVRRELYPVRNVHQAFEHGLIAGVAFSGLSLVSGGWWIGALRSRL